LAAFSAPKTTAPEGTLVLSYRLWRELFAADEAVLGRKVLLDGVPYSIIGVMPSGFYFPDRDALLWTAMRFAPPDFRDRTNCYIYGIGRLKPGTSVEQAAAEMQSVTGQLARLYPEDLAHTGAVLTRLRDDIEPQARLMLNALLGAAICVLLIACTNLANLLLARSAARRRERAVRAAMGAGRERLVRQMLTESVLLATAGGVLGVLVGMAALPLLMRLVPVSLPVAQRPSIDLRVLLFAVLLTFTTGIGFGVVPAVRSGRGADANRLREGARCGGGLRERSRAALVVVEIAACMVLLVSAGLLIRALWRGWMPRYPPKDLVVRASGDAAMLAPALRRSIHDADPEQPVSDVQTLTEIVDAETGARSVQLTVLGVFAAIAFLLAGIGIHGLLSYYVSQRTQEIGVRIALGAPGSLILGMILSQGLLLAAAGVVIGGAAALPVGQALRAVLAGVQPSDVDAFLGAALLAVMMVAAGSLLPALRAVRVDPIPGDPDGMNQSQKELQPQKNFSARAI
jgi:cell division protein FtsX